MRTSLCGHKVPAEDVPVEDVLDGDVPVEDIMSAQGFYFCFYFCPFVRYIRQLRRGFDKLMVLCGPLL